MGLCVPPLIMTVMVRGVVVGVVGVVGVVADGCCC